MKTQLTLEKLSQALQGKLVCKDPSKTIKEVKPLDGATACDLSFFHNLAYLEKLKNTQAGACLVSEKHALHVPENVAAIICEKPYESLGKAILLLTPNQQPLYPNTLEIHPTAHVHPDVIFHGSAFIGPYSVIAQGVQIGDQTIIEAFAHLKNVTLGKRCHIGSHVTLQEAILGNQVTVKNGARIGQEGFGFSMEDPLSRTKIPQIGKVILEDFVDIGSNTTIDRGSLDNTFIGAYTKIDNLVQVAHNVVIGKFCIVAAQTGISGSTRIGDYVMVGGQVGFSGHLNIADYTQIAAKSGVMRSTKNFDKIAGIPAVDISLWRRGCVLLKRLAQRHP